jgi:hypothetical protein
MPSSEIISKGRLRNSAMDRNGNFFPQEETLYQHEEIVESSVNRNPQDLRDSSENIQAGSLSPEDQELWVQLDGWTSEVYSYRSNDP